MTIEAEAEAPVAPYTFDQAFQRKIAALVVRDTMFAQRSDGLVDPAYFENDADKAIVGVALDYFKTYKKAPDSLVTLTSVLKQAILDKRIRKDLVPDVRAAAGEMLKADLSDSQYVLDQVADFARFRALDNAIMGSVAALEKKDYETIRKLISQAMDVGVNHDDVAYDYWTEIENRTKRRLALNAGTLKTDTISTGYAEIDKYLFEGGFGRRELSVIMGAAKAGKSMSLGDFGKNASLLGKNVIYFTLEVAGRIIADRVDANISETAMRVLKDAPFNVEKAVKAAQAKAGKFVIHDYPSGTLKCSDIRRILERYRSKGIIFDVIIVDYADLMAAEHRSDEHRENLRQIYVDLRALGSIYNAAVLSATQSNREGAKSMTAKATNVSEDWSKAMTVDLLLSINANEDEIKRGEARIFFALSRNEESGFSLRIQQDRAKMKFVTKVLGKE